jgi:geranylgeranyl diphosphate synthase type I
LIGLFGSEEAAGKSTASDYLEGKRTFPLIAAYTRAGAQGREALEDLWGRPDKDLQGLEDARREVDRHGGRAATERVIDRVTRSARRALSSLPPGGPAREMLDFLFSQLARRDA